MTLQLARRSFVEGYELGLRLESPVRMATLLAAVSGLPPERRPFAFEGVGMALRTRERHEGGGPWLAPALHQADPLWHLFLRLGEGCALARLREPLPSHPDVQDGYGFQTGLSARASSVRIVLDVPRARCGLGRALWFTTDGNAAACAALMVRVEAPEDWWRGVGTACVFAGDPRTVAVQLRARSGEHREAVASGAREALRLWSALPGGVPERARRAADALAPAASGPC